jgi:hypothetical protein
MSVFIHFHVDSVSGTFHGHSEAGCFSAAERFGDDSAVRREGPKEERGGGLSYSYCQNLKMKARCPADGNRTVGAGSLPAGQRTTLKVQRRIAASIKSSEQDTSYL